MLSTLIGTPLLAAVPTAAAASSQASKRLLPPVCAGSGPTQAGLAISAGRPGMVPVSMIDW